VITDDNERANAATSGRNSTASEAYRAALYICSRAKSPEDAALLMRALGLLESGVEWKSTGPHGPRRKVTG
jgi:hypothetical protein